MSTEEISGEEVEEQEQEECEGETWKRTTEMHMQQQLALQVLFVEPLDAVQCCSRLSS